LFAINNYTSSLWTYLETIIYHLQNAMSPFVHFLYFIIFLTTQLREI